MSKTIGRNTNVNNEATISDAITLNSTTSTVISVANSTRINFTVSNNSSQDVWLKFQPASGDDVKKGIFLFKRTIYEMPTDNIYTGEISAIAESGTPDVFVSEF